MATTLVFSLINTCAGGQHATIGVSVNGGAVKPYMVEVDDLRGPVSEDQRETVIQVISKLSVAGLTRVQARNKFQAGFTVELP